MNTGLQDAYNLAWKLALVTSGRANTTLLDSYEAERMPVAKRLLITTDRAFALVVSDSWWAGLFRTRVLAKLAAFAMTRDRIRTLAFRTISQIGIRYPDSSLSETLAGLPDTAPRAGDRFPWLRLKLQPNGPIENLFAKLDDTRFNLIVIGQPSAVLTCRDSVTCCACLQCRATPPTTRNSHAQRSLSHRSTCCVPTAMWGLRGLTWMPTQ